MKDTPEQARLRTAADKLRSTLDHGFMEDEDAHELLYAAEAVLPKRERWADYSEIGVESHPQGVYLGDEARINCGALPSDIADRAQAIRAAVLLKHSKRLMEAPNRDELMQALNEMNAEADRLIAEAGV